MYGLGFSPKLAVRNVLSPRVFGPVYGESSPSRTKESFDERHTRRCWS